MRIKSSWIKSKKIGKIDSDIDLLLFTDDEDGRTKGYLEELRTEPHVKDMIIP